MTKRKARRKVVAQSREAAVLSFPPSFARNFHRERETSGYETDVRRSRKLTFVEMMSARLGSFQVYHRKRLSLKRK